MKRRVITHLALILTLISGATARAQVGAGASGAVVKTEFIGDPLPTPSCHASTIVESGGSLLAAWFGGSDEGERDVVIWLSRDDGRGWSKPEQVANGIYDRERIQYPLWNPVLFQPTGGPLLLFYKEGPSPSTWWGMLKSSDDNGKTWSKAKRLPTGIYGPIRAKPVELADGTIIAGSSTEDAGWRVHIEWTKNPTGLQSWNRTAALNRAIDFGAIQPTLINWPDGNLQMLCRTKQNVITESWSNDKGRNWTRMRATDLPNPSSGIDTVLLHDGRALLVYNHTDSGRGMLNLALSKDGREWSGALALETTPGSEFSYPAIIQTPDKLVHVTYTWNRKKIKHVVLDPSKLSGKPIVGGEWPY